MKDSGMAGLIEDAVWSTTNAVQGFYSSKHALWEKVLRVCRTLAHTITALDLPNAEATKLPGELAIEPDVPFLHKLQPTIRTHVTRVSSTLARQHARIRTRCGAESVPRVDLLYRNLNVCLHVVAWGLAALPMGAELYRCVAALAHPFDSHAAKLLNVSGLVWLELEKARVRAASAPQALPATCFSGLEDFRETLHQKVVLAARAPGLVRGARSVLLYGPRGCGKSQLALCALRAAPHEQYIVHARLLAPSVSVQDLMRAANSSARAASRRDALILEDVHVLEARGVPPWSENAHVVVFATSADVKPQRDGTSPFFQSFEHRVFVDVPSAAVRRALVEESLLRALNLSESKDDEQYKKQLRTHPTYARALNLLVSSLAPDYERLRLELAAEGASARSWLKYYVLRFADDAERADALQLVRYGTTDELQRYSQLLELRSKQREQIAHDLESELARELSTLLGALDELQDSLERVGVPLPGGSALARSYALSTSSTARASFIAYLARSVHAYRKPILLTALTVAAGTALLPAGAVFAAASGASSAVLAAASGASSAVLAAASGASSAVLAAASSAAAALPGVLPAVALGKLALDSTGPSAAQRRDVQERTLVDFRKRTSLDSLAALGRELLVERARVTEALRRAQLRPGDEAAELTAVDAARALRDLSRRYALEAERAHSNFKEYTHALRARSQECAHVRSTLDFAADARSTTAEDIEREFNSFPHVPFDRKGAYSAAAATRARYIASQHANAVSEKDAEKATLALAWLTRFFLDFGSIPSSGAVAKTNTQASAFLTIGEQYFEQVVAPHLITVFNKRSRQLGSSAKLDQAHKLLQETAQKKEAIEQAEDDLKVLDDEITKLEKDINEIVEDMQIQRDSKKPTVVVKEAKGWWFYGTAAEIVPIDLYLKDNAAKIDNLKSMLNESRKTRKTVKEGVDALKKKLKEAEKVYEEAERAYEESDDIEITVEPPKQYSFATGDATAPQKPNVTLAIPPEIAKNLELTMVTSVSPVRVETFVREVFKLGDRCDASVLVSAWFAALYARNPQTVDATLVQNEMRYRKDADSGGYARVHLLVAFLRYVLIAAMVEDVPQKRDGEFFKTLDVGRDLNDAERVTRQMHFARFSDVKDAHWKAYANPLSLGSLKKAVANVKWFAALRAQSFGAAQKFFGEWSASGETYCKAQTEPEQPPRTSWKLKDGSTVFQAKLKAHSNFEWGSFFDTGEGALEVRFQYYEKHNTLHSLKGLPALPGREKEAQAVVKRVEEALDKVRAGEFLEIALTGGARSPDLCAPSGTQSGSNTFDDLLTDRPTQHFDSQRVHAVCSAFFKHQNDATPVWWHAELDAAALLAIVLRGEPHPMAFTRVDQRDAWCVPHIAYATLLPRFEKALSAVLPFEYTLRRAYLSVAHSGKDATALTREHVFFAWALELFRDEMRTLRAWIENVLPDIVASTSDAARVTELFREKTGYVLVFDNAHVGLLRAARLPVGKTYLSSDYDAFTSGFQNAEKFAERATQEDAEKHFTSRETVAAHALLVEYARAPVADSALVELRAQLQEHAAYTFRNLVSEHIRELSNQPSSASAVKLASKSLSSNSFSLNSIRLDNKKYERVWYKNNAGIFEVENGNINLAKPVNQASLQNFSDAEVTPKGNLNRILVYEKKVKDYSQWERLWLNKADKTLQPNVSKEIKITKSRSGVWVNDTDRVMMILHEDAKVPVAVSVVDDVKNTAKAIPSVEQLERFVYYNDSGQPHIYVYDEFSKRDMVYNNLKRELVSYSTNSEMNDEYDRWIKKAPTLRILLKDNELGVYTTKRTPPLHEKVQSSDTKSTELYRKLEAVADYAPIYTIGDLGILRPGWTKPSQPTEVWYPIEKIERLASNSVRNGLMTLIFDSGRVKVTYTDKYTEADKSAVVEYNSSAFESDGIRFAYDSHTGADVAYDVKTEKIVPKKLTALKAAYTDGGTKPKPPEAAKQKSTNAGKPSSGSGTPSGGFGSPSGQGSVWTDAEAAYDGLTYLRFHELVHAALDARLQRVAATALSRLFQDSVASTSAHDVALVQPAALRESGNFEVAASHQLGWDALTIAPRRTARYSPLSTEVEAPLSQQEADRKVEQAFRALRELQHARRLAPYGYSARDISSAARQGVEDFVYSTLNASPKAEECIPFCSETSVNDKGEREKRCKVKECSSSVFNGLEVAHRVERVKEYVCGPLFGGSDSDRSCGMPVAELSALFASFLKMYRENPDSYTHSTLTALSRQLEAQLSQADSARAPSSAHTLVPAVTRSATLHSTQPAALYELFRHICVVLESKRSSVTRSEYLPLLKYHLNSL